MKIPTIPDFKYLNYGEKKVYAMAITSFLTLTILGIGFIKPGLSTVLTLRKTAAEAQKLNNILSVKIINLEQAKKNLQINKDKIDAINLLLPETDDQALLLRFLDSTALRNNVFLTKTSFEPVERQEELNAYVRKITIEVSGSYDDIMNFAKSLENGARFVKIGSLYFNNEDKTQTASIVLNVLSLTNKYEVR